MFLGRGRGATLESGLCTHLLSTYYVPGTVPHPCGGEGGLIFLSEKFCKANGIMTHLKKKKKKKISEAERSGVTLCKVRELVRSRARTRGLVGLMLSFLRRCLWAQVGHVWRGETGGRRAREEARRRSRVRGPGGEKGAGRESPAGMDGLGGIFSPSLPASLRHLLQRSTSHWSYF